MLNASQALEPKARMRMTGARRSVRRSRPVPRLAVLRDEVAEPVRSAVPGRASKHRARKAFWRIDTPFPGQDNARLVAAEGYSSGQRGQTVNLLASAYVGSSPTPSTNVQPVGERRAPRVHVAARERSPPSQCGCSSMVEPQPSKLMTWVRIPSPAPIGARQVVRAHIAQSVEHFLGKEEVTGSNPVVGSRSKRLNPERRACRTQLDI